MGFQPAQFINKRPMGHIAHTDKTVQINKHILLYHNFDKNKRRKKKLLIDENLLVLHLKKLGSPSPKDTLCQVWLKLI